MDEVKICRDCKHYRTIKLSAGCIQGNICGHPTNVYIDLVTGDEKYKDPADMLRYHDYRCGQKGKWYEPKI